MKGSGHDRNTREEEEMRRLREDPFYWRQSWRGKVENTDEWSTQTHPALWDQYTTALLFSTPSLCSPLLVFYLAQKHKTFQQSPSVNSLWTHRWKLGWRNRLINISEWVAGWTWNAPVMFVHSPEKEKPKSLCLLETLGWWGMFQIYWEKKNEVCRYVSELKRP